MITINDGKRDFSFENKFSEISMEQYDNINFILNKESETEVAQWVEVIAYLTKQSKKAIDEWSYKDFVYIVDNLFIDFNDVIVSQNTTISIDNVEYTDKVKEAKIKDLIEFESIMKNEEVYKMSKMISYIYGCDIEIIKKQKLSIFIAPILKYGKELNEHIKLLVQR